MKYLLFFRRHLNLALGGFIVALFVLMALFAPLIAPFDPVDDANLLVAEQPPDGR